MTEPAPIEAVISDFGGVLTAPMIDSFTAFQDSSGISLEQLGVAMGKLWERQGSHPLFELETGRMAEARFLELMSQQLSSQLGCEVTLNGFGERYFAHLHPNEPMIEYMRALRERGYKLAICTNNVREWERFWRAKLPVDEIFDVVVDSAFVGARKPEPRIYEITLERLGVAPEAALLIDDLELNCDGARAVGIEAIWFRSTEQAIADIEAAVGSRDGRGAAGPADLASGEAEHASDGW
jgi:putative hydrolase of the HAD superfamily